MNIVPNYLSRYGSSCKSPMNKKLSILCWLIRWGAHKPILCSFQMAWASILFVICSHLSCYGCDVDVGSKTFLTLALVHGCSEFMFCFYFVCAFFRFNLHQKVLPCIHCIQWHLILSNFFVYVLLVLVKVLVVLGWKFWFLTIIPRILSHSSFSLCASWRKHRLQGKLHKLTTIQLPWSFVN